MGIRDSFGQAGKGSSSKFKMHNFDSKVESSTLGPFRILPPMGDLMNDPRGWRVYHGVHYGYKGVAFGSDKTKTRNRVFACIEEIDFKTKMIKRSCPECRLIEQKERKLQDIADDIKMNLKSQGLLDEKALDAAVDAKLKNNEEAKALTEWLDVHNRDGKYYVNLVDKEYAPGLIKLAKRHIEAIEEQIDILAKKGVAALNDFDQGAWFFLTRKGFGNSTKHLASFEEEPIPGVPGASKPKLAPLSDAVLENAVACLPNLKIPPMASILNADQIALLTECSGDPEEVDAIFKMTERSPGQSQASSGTTTSAPSQQPKPQPQSQKLPEASSKPASTAAAPQAPAGVDPRVAQMRAMGFTDAQIEAAGIKIAPAPAPVDPRVAQMKALGFTDAQIEAALGAKPSAAAPAQEKAPEPQPQVKTEAAHVADDVSGLDPEMDTNKFAEEFALPQR